MRLSAVKAPAKTTADMMLNGHCRTALKSGIEMLKWKRCKGGAMVCRT
jgi:hypothetical protein